MRAARRASGLAGFAIALAAVIGGTSALSAVLLALVPLAFASMPTWWWSRRWLAFAALVAFALAGIYLPASRTLRQLPIDGRTAHWWALALQCWCGAGLSLIALAGAARLLRLGGRWIGPAMALAAMLAAPLIGMPLMLLFPAHLIGTTPESAPHQDFTVDGIDGVTLSARLIEPDGGALGVAVFTHGKAAWKERHPDTVALLCGLGWAVVVWDLPGHGRSSPAACGHGPDEGDDLVRVWAATRAMRPDLPMIAVGISLGGAATLFAGDRLDRCGGIVIENAYASLDDLVESSAPGPVAPVTRALCRLALGRWPSGIRPVDAPVLRSGPPLLLGISGGDRVVPPAQGEKLAAACPRAVIVRVPGIGHLDLIHNDRWREAVKGVLFRAMMESTPPNGTSDRTSGHPGAAPPSPPRQ